MPVPKTNLMEKDLKEENPIDENLISLAGEIAKDSQRLVEQELSLLQTELLADWNKTKRALPMLFLSAIGAVTVCTLISLACADWLVVQRGYPLWVAYGVLALAGFFATSLFYLGGRRRLNSVSLYPKQTIKSFKENLQCLTN